MLRFVYIIKFVAAYNNAICTLKDPFSYVWKHNDEKKWKKKP